MMPGTLLRLPDRAAGAVKERDAGIVEDLQRIAGRRAALGSEA